MPSSVPFVSAILDATAQHIIVLSSRIHGDSRAQLTGYITLYIMECCLALTQPECAPTGLDPIASLPLVPVYLLIKEDACLFRTNSIHDTDIRSTENAIM